MLEQPTDTIKRAFRFRQTDQFAHGFAICELPARKPRATGTGKNRRSRLDGRDSSLPPSNSSVLRVKDAKTPRRRVTAEIRQRTQTSQDADGIGLYLHQALQTPLLTKDQERQLAQTIFRYRQAFQRMVLKEPAVIAYLREMLVQWDAKQIRLDTVCNLALSETSKRKTLEPRIRDSLETLKRLPKQIESSESREQLRHLERFTVQLFDRLMIRPRPFETAPFKNPKARQLLDEYRRNCQAMTRANLRLVVVVAKKLCGNSPVLLDMIQEGNRGLMHAVTKFDHQRNLRFSTYATPWIKQSIFAALPNSERNIRIPENFGSLARTIQRRMQDTSGCDYDLSHLDSGRNISCIASEMNLPPTDVVRLVCIQRDTSSLNQPGNALAQDGTDTNSCLAETIADHRRTCPLQMAEVRERKQIVQSLMDQALNKREHDVISLRFGLADGKDRSLAEVGRQMGITRERVRQVEKQAIQKLGNANTPLKLL